MTRPAEITRRTFLGRAAGTATAGLLVSELVARTAQAGPVPAAGWQIGIYTRPWDQFDYRTALDAIAEAGFRYAGLMTAKAKGNLVITAQSTPEEVGAVAEDLAKRKLKVPSVYGGGIPVEKSLQAGIDGMRRLVDNCAGVGAASILMGGIGNPKLVEPYYKAIAECCDYAAEKGMTVAVKPHGPLNATGPECRKAADMVGKKNFGVWYDPGNIMYYSEGKLDPARDAASVAGTVKGICIKDFVMGQKEGKPFRDVWVTPGEGKVDFPAVLATLKRGGFAGGALVIECVARKDPKDLKTLLAEAKKAKRFVEQLVGG
jgi:sugar phosphate isomerase/epimerase